MRNIFFIAVSVFGFVTSIQAEQPDIGKFGIKYHALNEDQDWEDIQCRYYVALDSGNIDRVSKVSIRTYDRNAGAFIKFGSIENQKKTRSLENFKANGIEWERSFLVPLVKKKLKGFSEYVQAENEVVFDVTDAIQKQLTGTWLSFLLNISIEVVGSQSDKPIITHEQGAKTVGVSSVPFHDPNVYNKGNSIFPMRLPKFQTLGRALKGDIREQLPNLQTRLEATSHGLRFGNIFGPNYFGIITLNLYRQCVVS